MTLNNFIPGNEETQVLDGLNNYVQDNANRLYELNKKENLSEYVQNIGRIHKIAPGLPGGIVTALANANADDTTIARVYQANLALEAKKAEDAAAEAEKHRNWWQRNVWQKVVTGGKWTTAALNTIVQLGDTVGVSSVSSVAPKPSKDQLFSLDWHNPFRKGWWASTDLGTLMLEDEKSGSGFFIKGDADINKSNRLLDYAGAIPLTVEAGAGENTAVQIPYDSVREYATQLMAQDPNLTFDEAMSQANTALRSQAKMPVQLHSLMPLWFPRTNANGLPQPRFEFSEIGSTEFNSAAAMFNLIEAFTTPDPISGLFKVGKNLAVYARAGRYVDKAGNFVIPAENIAQTGAEAALLSRIDAINLIAKESDAAGIAATDAAVETLSPQPGVWWHGSRGGPVPGNNFVSIIDPMYPTPEGNLVGPALYLSEAPVIGSSYVSINALGTTELAADELALLQKAAPQDISNLTLRLGRPVDELAEGANPATLYRFTEKAGSNPTLIHPEMGLGSQMPAEFVQKMVDEVFGGAGGQSGLFVGVEPGLDGFSALEKSVDVNDVAEILANDGVMAAQRAQTGVRADPGYLFDNNFTPDVQDALKFPVNDNVVRSRVNNAMVDFFLANDKFPETVDEFKAFLGDEAYAGLVDNPASIANGDVITTNSAFLHGRGNVYQIIANKHQQMLAKVDELVRDLLNPFVETSAENAKLAENLTNMSRHLQKEMFYGKTYDVGLIDMAPRVLAESLFTPLSSVDLPFSMKMIIDDLAPRFRDVLNSRIANAGEKLTSQEVDELSKFVAGEQDLVGKAWAEFLFPKKGRWSSIHSADNRASWMRINSWLLENGVDGYYHTGGSRVGGGIYEHAVKAIFDPLKHFDVTDPLTGEKIVLNEALQKMIEAGTHGDAAAAARAEADRLLAMKDAGILDGYGPTVDPAQFSTVFTKSRGGRRAVDRIWELSKQYDTKAPVVGTTKQETWYKLWKEFDGKLPLNVLEDLLNAGSREEIVSVLNKHVGWTPGLTGMKDVNLPLSNVFGKLKANSRIDNLMTGISEAIRPLTGRSPSSKTLDIFGSEAAQLRALKDIDAFLETGVRGANKQASLRALILKEFADGMMTGDKARMFAASSSIADAIRFRILAETGDAAQAAKAADVWQLKFDEASGSGLYQVGKEGMRIDNNYAVELYDNGAITMHNMTHGGPGLLSELQRTPLELPDVQELRRMTSWMGILTGKQGIQRAIKSSETGRAIAQRMGLNLTEKELAKLGELRIPLRLVDFAMTGVWKNFKKLSLGYGLRNTMEAQARLAFSDVDNLFSHPLDHILVSMFQKLPDDIALGERFNVEGWRNLGAAHEAAGEGYRQVLGGAFYGSEQRVDMMKSMFRNGEIVVFSKDIPQKWAYAGGYELRQLFNDVIARRFANGDDLDTVMNWLYSDAPEAQKALGQIETLMKNGERFYHPTGASEDLPVAFTPDNVRIRVKTQQEERLMLKTGGDPLLLEVAGKGTINGKPAFRPNGQPTKDLVDHLTSQVNNPNLPAFYKGRASSTINMKNADNMFKQAMSMFFDGFMGRAHNVLDRSPLWRQLYTQEISRLAPLMSPEAAAEMKALILERVDHYAGVAKASKFKTKFTIEDYLGRNVDPDELMAALDNAKGWATREDIHNLANATTLDKVENLLFDASARNSITDAARIVSPFGAAFSEVFKTWIKLIAVNPDKVNSLAVKFGILSGQTQPAALRNNGIMHQDPITGDWMYSLPASGAVFNLLNKLPGIGGRDTGADYQLEAPVKGLNMAFNAVPGFSPVVGFPLGRLLYGKSNTRDFAAFLLPYGQPKSPFDVKEYLPGWASKIISGLFDDPKMAGVYGDTVADVARVEYATGKWQNINDPEIRQQFFDDVESKSRILAIMRGFGQLVGPASPQVTARIQTQFGNAMAGYYTAAFHKMQSEDYDTAVQRFLDTFGDDFMLFTAGKTRSVYMGVESSKEFAKWELDNPDLFDSAFKDVAGFFGPKGSMFDWAAYQNQINSGKKERVPAIPDQIEIAEMITGLAEYRYLVNITGPAQTEGQREVLKQYRLGLEKKYPGMVTQGKVDVTEFDNRVKQLRLAVEDPRLKDNETAITLKKYLDMRDTLIAVAKSSGVGWSATSEKTAPLRAMLLYEGSQLVKETPEFARVFDSLLINEVKQ